MRSNTSFVCQECGYDSPQWLGKCPECGNWNSLKEISNVQYQISNAQSQNTSNLEPKKISEIKFESRDRLSTGFSEADTVLGGGIVKGSVILLAGDPGIGKSTLLLQIAMNLANQKTQNTQKAGKSDNQKLRQSDPPSSPSIPNPVLYISGEESEEQVKMRARRLKPYDTKNLLLISLSNTDAAVEVIARVKPALVIVDSIQALESENLSGLSGSVGQVRYATGELIKTAKNLGIPVILVGHVTKEGMVAGPMLLSHMVDTVLFLEGEKFTAIRILRSLKNRFGPVDEVGVFVMEEAGMKDVSNPESLFLSEDRIESPGSCLVVTQEGSRAFLVEIQALVVFSRLPMPRRIAAGIDGRRLELIIAILQKHGNLPLDTMDVYVNVAGGLKLSDPAADLGICLAIFSSLKSVPMSKTVAIAEVGLLGELRRIPGYDKKTREAKKLGFNKIIGGEKHKP